MPSTSDVHSFVQNALNQQRLDLARPWRPRLLESAKEPTSLVLLARLAAAENDLVDALTFSGEAIRIDPYFVDAYLLRAALLGEAGAYDEAIRNYQSVLLFSPLHDDAVRGIYLAAQQAGRPQASIDALRRRLRVGPDTAEFRNLLGLALHNSGDLKGALDAYERALEIDPQSPLFHNNRATILYHLERYTDALHALEQALMLHSEYATAWQNIGNVNKAMGNLRQALDANRRALNISPNYAEAHFNLGCALLQQNNWDEGWREYEWRWQVPGMVAPIHAHVPPWQGEPLDGQIIMVVAEQGSGDTLQFARYLPELTKRGAQIVIWAPAETVSLLRRQPHVLAAATNRAELPQPTCYAPMMSLPRLLGASVYAIPQAPYLEVDHRRVSAFLRELGPRQENLRIGISWAGNPKQVEDKHRSAPLRALAPLFEMPSVRWISVQKGPRSADIEPSGFRIEDWSESLHSFDETAALVSALDGVVSICSAPIHVAGALNIPAACMLTHSADWRWCEEESTTIWYSSVRLIRQHSLNDWHDVASRTAAHIGTWKPKGLSRNPA